MARTGWCTLLAAALAVAVPALGDDWAQFRRDPEHSAASKDKVPVPLTELWSWTHLAGRAPVYHAAIWHGHVYYLTREGQSRIQRRLVCADARTGSVLWQQDLNTAQLSSLMSDSVGPAVSPNGTVFVYDYAPVLQLTNVKARNTVQRRSERDHPAPNISHISSRGGGGGIGVDNWTVGIVAALLGSARADITAALPDPTIRYNLSYVNRRRLAGGGIEYTGGYFYNVSTLKQNADGKLTGDQEKAQAEASIRLEPIPTFCLRTFSGVSGTPGPQLAIGTGGMDVMSLLRLQHPPLDVDTAAVPLLTIGSGSSIQDTLGPPLIRDEALIATTEDDSLVRWKPFPRPDEFPLYQVHITHPLSGSPDDPPPTLFNGVPPTSLSSGYVLGTDAFNRFLATVDPASPRAAVHVDLSNSLGVPATHQGHMFVGLGGSAATRGIAAVDGLSGKAAWVYAPNGLPHESPNKTKGYAPGQPAASHWLNPGVAVTDGQVFAEVEGAIVALERDTGKLRWRYPLTGTVARSIVASADYLFVCLSRSRAVRKPVWDELGASENSLVALKLADGKLAWEQPVPRAGNLAVAEGLLFLTDGGLHVYGPAERIFRLAADSPHPEDYLPAETRHPADAEAVDKAEKPDPSEVSATPTKPNETNGQTNGANGAQAAPLPKRPRTVADATCLYLRVGPAESLAARVRERRKLAPQTPMLLSLDPLDSGRLAWLDNLGGQPLSAEWIAGYARLCAALADAGHPEHFEVLPDVNVYLNRFPEKAASVHDLLSAATRAIHAASPATRVCASLNQEVLSGQYGRGTFLPFGKLPETGKQRLADLLAVLSPVDEFGLSAYPQSAYSQTSLMPVNYFQASAQALSGKPLLITRLAVRLDERVSVAEQEQERFLRLLFRSAYWLDAPLICYPELVRDRDDPRDASQVLRVGDTTRKALDVWQAVLSWKRVERRETPVHEKAGEG